MPGGTVRKFWFIAIAFALTDCSGQAFSYRLHNPQNAGDYSTLHTMPDGDLLVLTKRIEQPKQIWKLHRMPC